jgi:cbb3-type cytochrome oxidase maturation protein
MEAIYLLIFMGAVVAVGFLVAFFISVKNGQFEDNETPAMRILFDDDKPKERVEISDADIKDIEN